MDVAVSIIGIVCFTAVAYKSDISSKISNWYTDKKNKAKIAVSLIENIASNQTVAFNVNDTDKSATILYSRLGKKAILFIPFNRDYAPKMISFKAELTRDIRDERPSLNITQQPGIPYMVTGRSLGGHFIKITNRENEKTIVFGPDEVPGYAEELFE